MGRTRAEVVELIDEVDNDIWFCHENGPWIQL